jgi:serine/threonine protein kinase
MQSGYLLAGRYQLLDIIGVGGMATVYRGREEGLNREVAIKVVASHLALNPDYIERFNREAQTIATLQHPNIIQIYYYGVEPAGSFVVMPLLKGGTLMERMRQSRKLISIREVGDLALKVGSALHHAHEVGIIHRDIKFSNIMFDSGGNPYVMDFGIARMMDTTQLTATGGHVGTPQFMAPEQWRGDITPAVDQYALAVVLYELLSGKRPFDGATSHELMYQHLEVIPLPVSVHREDTPANVVAVLNRALSKNPHERFPTMEAFAEAFHEACQEAPAASTNFFRFELQVIPNQPGTTTPGTPVLRGVAPISSSVSTSQLQAPEPRKTATGLPPLAIPVTIVATILVLALFAFWLNRTSNQEVVSQLTAVHLTSQKLEQDSTAQMVAIAATQSAIETSAVPPTVTRINTATDAPTETPSVTATATLSETPTATATPTATNTSTATATITPSQTSTLTATITPSHTSTLTATITPSQTSTPTATNTSTVTATHTMIPSATPVASFNLTADSLFKLEQFAPLFDVSFSPDNSMIATSGINGTAMWDTETGEIFFFLESPYGEGDIQLFARNVFNADGTMMATSLGNPTIYLWDESFDDFVLLLEGHTDIVTALAYAPDGVLLASAGSDGTIRLWDTLVNGDSLIRTIETEALLVLSLAFSPDGTMLAASTADSITVWDVTTWEQIGVLGGHEGSIFEIAFSPDGTRLVSTSDDSTLRLWDTENGNLIQVMEGHSDVVYSVAFSPDGDQIASASFDGTLRLWDGHTGDFIRTLDAGAEQSGIVRYSPDGKWIASADGNIVHIWEARTGALLASLEGHEQSINYLAISADGTMVASADSDGVIIIWLVNDTGAASTARLATNTPPPTRTQQPTATRTPRPTATRTPRPTATRTPRPTATPRPARDNSIDMDETVSGSLNVGSSQRWSFSGERGQVVSIVVSAEYDSTVTLIAPNGNQLAFNDDYTDLGDSRILDFELTTNGSYTIIVASFDNSSGGSYTLSLSDVSSTVSSRSGQAASASISMGETVSGTINVGGSQRWTFNGQSGQVVDIVVSADYDSTVTLIAPNSSLVAFNDDYTDVSDSRILGFHLTANGSYTIVVGSFNNGSGGSYTLRLSDASGTSLACSVRNSGSQGVNVRYGPGTFHSIAYTLYAGNDVIVTGQATDGSGFIWWRLMGGNYWVRSDTVTEYGDCNSVPFVEP